jgi:hypothetical protein
LVGQQAAHQDRAYVPSGPRSQAWLERSTTTLELAPPNGGVFFRFCPFCSDPVLSVCEIFDSARMSIAGGFPPVRCPM